MKELFKSIKKYWFIISIAFTILSSCVTGLWWIYGKIDKLNDTVTETNQWVQSHDDDIQALHDDVTKLKEDERFREAQEGK